MYEIVQISRDRNEKREENYARDILPLLKRRKVLTGGKRIDQNSLRDYQMTLI